MKTCLNITLACCALCFAGCATFQKIPFQKSDEIFITTGDGDAVKSYQPIGHLMYTAQGFRIPLPLLGFIPISDAVAGNAINEIIAEKARAMGGDAVIKLEVQWDPPSDGLLGLGAKGGALTINGTVIKRAAPGETIPTSSPAAQPEIARVETSPPAQPDIARAETSQTSSPPTQQRSYRRQENPLAVLVQGTLGQSFMLSYSNFAGDFPGSGLRLGFGLRRKGTKFSFTPGISFGSLSSEETISSFGETFRVETGTRMISVDLNVTANFGAFPDLQASLSPKLNPYAEAGLTYMISSFKAKSSSRFGGFDSGSDWDFFEPGLNLGLGAEYLVSPGIMISGGLKRYFIFDSPLDSWNWQVGVNLYPKR